MALPAEINPAATTTSVDLLLELKKILVANQRSTLKDVKTFKIGVLPPTPVFPAINVMPEEEFFVDTFSSGKYSVWRHYLIEVYSRHRLPAEAMNQTRDIVGYIKEIIKANRAVSGQAVD